MKAVKISSCWILLSLFFIYGCNIKTDKNRLELIKNEIRNVEQNFAELAKTDGVAKAFLTYASEEAVLYRDNKLFKGKEEIKAYFDKQTLKDIKLLWKPDYIDVALSGEMAYTYGNYTLSEIDLDGNNIIREGSFHTVWKRQKDNTWKFVWD